MSATNRENRLLVSEDWTKIYQSFRSADFQSYDFENIRRTMVNYLRKNYPEDFNDYIESSEYLSLIDLIAFFGQNVAFRVDLNARENFLELAERRDSVLRLARMISYNAKRNIASKGLLKFTTITTTESILDSNGRNLANQVITWNDPSNTNWFDQFIRIMNAAMPTSQYFGNPSDKATIYGIPCEQYRFNAANNDVPIYGFTKTISGTSMNFEVTSTTFKDRSYIYEEAPHVGNRIACVYRDDGQGAGSANSGFFFNFTQGSMNTGAFTITQPSTSETVNIETPGINDSDVWLYQLALSGIETSMWTPVPNLNGNNIIYNSLNNVKDIYTVTTRVGDAISLMFSDGVFGNLPQGSFRIYYRVSNGVTYTINPRDIRNVSITIPYLSATNQVHNLTISLALTTSVMNSAPSETNESVKTNAPQTYYTQNRMITAEDYNISPLSVSQQVLKVKAINRASSGISRYFDLIDPTSRYSSTTMFSDDGVLYQELYNKKTNFTFRTDSEIRYFVYNTLDDLFLTTGMKNFYYANFQYDVFASNSIFTPVTSDLYNTTGILSVTVPYVNVGSMLKLVAPPGFYFDIGNSNALVKGTANSKNRSYNIWVEVIRTYSNRYILNKPVGAYSETVQGVTTTYAPIVHTVIPPWTNSISDDTYLTETIIELMNIKEPFALRYNYDTQTWKIISKANLNTLSSFSLQYQGNTSETNLDASWMILFQYTNQSYVVSSREIKYVFESDTQLRFYFDGAAKIYDSKKSKLIQDSVSILSGNSDERVILTTATGVSGNNVIVIPKIFGIEVGMQVQHQYLPDNTFIVSITTYGYTQLSLTLSNVSTSDFTSSDIQFMYFNTATFNNDYRWKIVSNYVGNDGYVDTKKLIVSFFDSDNATSIEGPDLFEIVVSPTVNTNIKYIVQERYVISTGQEDYRYINNDANKVIILNYESQVGALGDYENGQYFYFKNSNTVKKLDKDASVLNPSLDYKVFVGRDGIKYQYTHAADYDSRIDPSSSNIMDVYILTQDYDIAFRQWLAGTISSKPLPPSSDELYNLLSPSLNLIKAISDEVIYHPVTYTVLFGENASPELQATFKVIKNPAQVISDNDIKTRVLAAINQFFSVQYWDFGDSFYFTELSTYVINQLAPNIVNFVIVPVQENLNFGSLFEISSSSNQLFINGATVDNIEIITNITTNNIKSVSGTEISASSSAARVITSAPYGSL